MEEPFGWKHLKKGKKSERETAAAEIGSKDLLGVKKKETQSIQQRRDQSPEGNTDASRKKATPLCKFNSFLFPGLSINNVTFDSLS